MDTIVIDIKPFQYSNCFTTVCAAALVGLVPAQAFAQTAAQTAEPSGKAAPENLLPPGDNSPAVPAPQTPPPASETHAAGIPMVSDPVVQAIDAMAEAQKAVVMDWSLTRAESLLQEIEAIGAEGLDPADYEPAALRAAIAAGEGDALNAMSSRLFSWVVEDLRDGRTPMEARKQWFVFDPDADRYTTKDLMQQALASGDVAATLDRIKPQHHDYAVLREELANTPVEQAKRRKLIRANMDRWRWLPRDLGSQYLMTNVPEYQLRLSVNGTNVRTYRTVVGKPGRTATPQLAESVEGVIFNPTWTVPQSIVKGEGLGVRVLRNPAWARNKGYKATRGANGWITVVQQPGRGNSLGLMKLDMPNKHAIFLHDTPSRYLFAREKRALSHGCIRTQRATELAMALAILRGGLTAQEAQDILRSGQYTRVGLERQMPVYITYFTMAQNIDGQLTIFSDIYGRDAAVLKSLDAPRVADRSRVIDEQIIPLEDNLQDT